MKQRKDQILGLIKVQVGTKQPQKSIISKAMLKRRISVEQFDYQNPIHLALICINNNQLHNMQSQSKSLQQILTYKAQYVTGFRFVLIYLAVYLSPTFPQTAGMIILSSVMLDYFDGMVARKYKQVSYFGEIFDWITDLCTYAVVLFWWNNLEPSLLLLFFTFFCLEVLMMMVDTVSKCYGYTPKLQANSLSTSILHYTMDLNKKGYVCSGIGYWNEILHFLCIISRILYLTTQSNFWYYCFLINIPASISYVWMHLAYSLNILDRWNEQTHDNEQFVKFIEE